MFVVCALLLVQHKITYLSYTQCHRVKFSLKFTAYDNWYQSLAAMSLNIKARMTILENILGVPAEGKQLSVCDRLDALSAKIAVIWNEISD